MKRQLEWLIVAGVLVLAGAAAALVGERMVLSQGSVSCTSYVGLWYITIEGPRRIEPARRLPSVTGAVAGPGTATLWHPGRSWRPRPAVATSWVGSHTP